MILYRVCKSSCRNIFKYGLFSIIGTFVCINTNAQKDTLKNQTVNVVSAFKPAIRNSVKINFSGTHLQADSTRPTLTYNIPEQNLFYSYRPIALKPLALLQDSNLYLGSRHFVKGGYGNYSTPYLNAAFSFGNGKKMLLNFYGDYISSKGKVKNLDYSQLNIKSAASFFGKKNELYTSLGLSQNNYFPDGQKNLGWLYQDISAGIGYRNIHAPGYSLKFNPNISISVFTKKDNIYEGTIVANIPVEKKINENFKFIAEAKADVTSYFTQGFIPNNYEDTNNVFQAATAVKYTKQGTVFNVGISPIWNNGKFILLPNIYGDIDVKKNGLTLQVGSVGRYIKNTYKNLSAQNPYLQTIFAQTNTLETEYFGGIKTSVNKHIIFNAKAALVVYKDFALFINDTLNESEFKIGIEPTLNNFRLHGDVSYINGEISNFTLGLTFNNYTGMKLNTKAWNTVPMELTAAYTRQVLKSLWVKGDFYMFGGGHYLEKGNTSKSFAAGMDLSIGAEYKINKLFNIWLDINNIFNDKYQRWHNYEVYGINLLGGIRLQF